jgi:hypothetical protein
LGLLSNCRKKEGRKAGMLFQKLNTGAARDCDEPSACLISETDKNITVL